jgi:nitrate/nitrite-specific signal transduction histidine kinase
MVWALETQRQDALLINLAGRQRMLLQQTARLAVDAGVGESYTNQELQEAQNAFEQSLQAMLHGGYAPYMPGEMVWLAGSHSPEIHTSLEQVNAGWEQYRPLLDEVQHTSPTGPRFQELASSIKQQVPVLQAQANAVVDLYEQEATSKLIRLRTIQIGFLVAGLALLAAGVLMTRRSLLQPLERLEVAAQRLGGNDLNTPVDVPGPQEIQSLSASFETMRRGLQSAQAELLELTRDLESRIRQRTRELDALHEVSQQITSQLDMQHVLHSVTDKVRTLLDGDSAMLCLLDESKEYLRLQAMSGKALIPVYESYMSTVDHASQALNSPGALMCREGQCTGGCGLFTSAHAPSHVVAPLRLGDELIGALCVASARPAHFTDESTGLLSKLSATAAVALQNARLYTQAERIAALEERHRVAADMHDGLGQMLSYLGIMTDQAMELVSEGRDSAALEQLKQTRTAVEQAAQEVRRAISSLIDEPLTRASLCQRLREVVRQFSAETGRQVDWDAALDPSAGCAGETVEQVMNITREALHNAARHAGPAALKVRLGCDETGYFVQVEDDGRGFDLSRPAPGGHFGLQVMRARAGHIGGTLDIQSSPGRGTCVKLVWPVERE